MKPTWQRRISKITIGCMMFAILLANPLVAAAATKMVIPFGDSVLTKEQVADDLYLSDVVTLNDNKSFVGLFASPSEYEYYFGTSKDLVNWELKSKYFSLVYGNGLFVGLNDTDMSDNTLRYTKDGEIWKEADLPDGIDPVAVKFENGYFKLTAFDENFDMHVYFSKDAETWYDLTGDVPEGAWAYRVISAGGKLYALVGTDISGDSVRVYAASSIGEEATSWSEIESLRKPGYGMFSTFFFDGETVGVELYSIAEYIANNGYVSNTLYYVTKDFINWEEKDWTKGAYDYYSPFDSTTTASKNIAPDAKRFEAVEVLPYLKEGEEWPSEYVSYIVHSKDGVNWQRDQVNIYVNGEKIGPDPAGRKAYIEGLEGFEWARAGAEYVIGRNYLSEWQLSPFGDNITRGDYLTLIMQALNVPEPAEPRSDYVPFDDVWWYDSMIERANRLGLVKGIGNNLFGTYDPIIRQDMMVMTYNILEKLGKIEPDRDLTALKNFKDANQVSDYAKLAVSSLVKAGIIAGNNGYINPKSHVTHAEAVVIAERLNKYRFR
jgi:hypothetical protein